MVERKGVSQSSRRLELLFISLLSLMLIFATGILLARSFTGNTNTLASGSIETTDLNVTGDWYRGTENVTDIILGNYIKSGSVITCYNGTWIPHGLPGDPGTTGSITVSLRGPSSYNATFIYRVPTILSSNTTHFQLEFTAWESVGWTQVPVTVAEAATVYWDATYNPP